MSNKETGGTAFPAQPVMKMPEGVSLIVEQGGMTLRDYFAAKAMQGLQANTHDSVLGMSHKQISEYAYACADAMLGARK